MESESVRSRDKERESGNEGRGVERGRERERVELCDVNPVSECLQYINYNRPRHHRLLIHIRVWVCVCASVCERSVRSSVDEA